MAQRRKAAFGLGCFIALPVGAIGMILGFSGYFENGQHEAVRQGLLGLSYAALAAYVSAMVAAIVHVVRRREFDGPRRTRWLLLLFFLNGFVLPFFWWLVIRPLPEPRST